MVYIKSTSVIWNKVNFKRFCFAMIGTAFCLIAGLAGAVPIFQRWVINSKISVIIGMGAIGAVAMSALAAIERYTLIIQPARQKRVRFACRVILLSVLMFTFAANVRLRIRNASDMEIIQAGIPLLIIPIGHVIFGGYAFWKSRREADNHKTTTNYRIFRATIIAAWIVWSILEFTKIADTSNRAFALAFVLLLESRIYDAEATAVPS
jgi:hypothetical protein